MTEHKDLRDIVINVIGGLVTAAILLLLRRVYPKSKEFLSRVMAACYRAISIVSFRFKNISSPLKKISFPAGAMRGVARFAGLTLGVVAQLAAYCLILFGMLLSGYSIIETAGGMFGANGRAKTFASYQGSTCDCPKPSSAAFYGGRIEPESGAGVPPVGHPEGYSIGLRYAAQSTFPTTEWVLDCPRARKGGKGERAIQPCAVRYLPKSGRVGGGSRYGIYSGPPR